MKKVVGAWALGALVLLNPAARAADPDAVRKAIDAGVNYLKGNGVGGGGGAGGNMLGATALIALTLLECDVDPGDDAITKAVGAVRNGALNATTTYDIALCIMFLDKFRDPADVALIESLTVRLLGGQSQSNGGWGYQCPPVSKEELQRLGDLLKKDSELVGKRTLPKNDDTGRTGKDLPKEIQDQLKVIGFRDEQMMQGNDNSNTQFATIALWVARRYGMPVDRALAKVNLRFRRSQGPDGGWTYNAGGGGGGGATPGAGLGNLQTSSAAMTCSGLLGIAVAHGVAADMELEKNKDKETKPKDETPLINLDQVVKKALAYLAANIDHPYGKRKAAIPKIGGTSYYFLWSLERVCVALGLETVNGKEWYDWGAEILIANQQADGSWTGQYVDFKADTCFALMFLKRANLVRDLSAKLKGKLQDRSLRGGVGPGSLKDPVSGDKPEGGSSDKPNNDPKETRVGVAPKESERLAREVLDAKPESQKEKLEMLADGKGTQYTEALLATISRLGGESKQFARESLADRLSRLTPERRTAYLDSEDVELRRAAALGCALSKDKTHVPQLIGMLRDRELLVARAAWAALKNLTGQNFGPTIDATDADKDKAIEAWREWWAKNGK